MFQIDKNVPPPSQRGKYPFAQMVPGDSFEMDASRRSTVIGAANYYATKNPGVRFVVRKTGPGKCRCWRVA